MGLSRAKRPLGLLLALSSAIPLPLLPPPQPARVLEPRFHRPGKIAWHLCEHLKSESKERGNKEFVVEHLLQRHHLAWVQTPPQPMEAFSKYKARSNILRLNPESKDPTDTRAKTTKYGYWPTKDPFPFRILEPSCSSPVHAPYGYFHAPCGYFHAPRGYFHGLSMV